MNQTVMDEIEACIGAVPGLASVPVLWGVDPGSHHDATTYPRIGVYVAVPSEREVFRDVARVAYQVRIGYFVRLAQAWPTDKATLVQVQERAREVRQAIRNIYERQITGESLLPIDIEGSTEQEISVLDAHCVVGTLLTLVCMESV